MKFDIDRYLRYLEKYPRVYDRASAVVDAFRRFKRNQYAVTMAAVGVFLLTIMVYSLPRPYVYENKKFGYYVIIPASWRKSMSGDEAEVTLTRRQRGSLGHAEIRIDVEVGNPYGTTPFDYAYNGLYKRIRYYYGIGNGRIDIQDYPYNKRFSGLDWAIFAFTVDNKNFYRVYVTQKENFIYTFTLITSGWVQDKAQEEFRNLVRSVFLERRDHTNVFTDPNEHVLFSHPM
jgi:hypothetical protein